MKENYKQCEECKIIWNCEESELSTCPICYFPKPLVPERLKGESLRIKTTPKRKNFIGGVCKWCGDYTTHTCCRLCESKNAKVLYQRLKREGKFVRIKGIEPLSFVNPSDVPYH